MSSLWLVAWSLLLAEWLARNWWPFTLMTPLRSYLKALPNQLDQITSNVATNLTPDPILPVLKQSWTYYPIGSGLKFDQVRLRDIPPLFNDRILTRSPDRSSAVSKMAYSNPSLLSYQTWPRTTSRAPRSMSTFDASVNNGPGSSWALARPNF